MNRTDVHHRLFPAIHGIACQQGQVEQRTVAPHLELIVQRAGQTDKDCCDCSGISGRFHCEPSAVRGEWRYTEAGIDVVVSLIRATERPVRVGGHCCWSNRGIGCTRRSSITANRWVRMCPKAHGP